MTPQDILAAGVDLLAVRSGLDIRHPHPAARGISLCDLAVACAAIAQPGIPLHDRRAAYGFGMGTAEFSRVLADSAAPLVAQRFTDSAKHRRFCSEIEVDDFKPIEIPGADLEVEMLEAGPGGEIQHGHATVAAGATEVKISRYVRNLLIGRQVVLGDRVGFVAGLVGAVGSTAARLEGRLVADALEANTSLDDGGPVFHSDYGNLVESALDAATLDQAMVALRNQRMAGGGRADLELAQLVVAPSLELTAHKLLHDHGLLGRAVVTALAALPAGRWFAMAAPEIAPCVATLKLGDGPSARVEPLRRPPQFEGVAMRAAAELGAVIVSRIGIVRGGA